MCIDTDWSNQSPYAPMLINNLTGWALGSASGDTSVLVSADSLRAARLRFVEGVFFALFVATLILLASIGAA